MDVRHVTLHGHSVAYRVLGDGPVIVLIHGMAGSSRTWLDAMPLLARDYTVIAPDLPGHGESDEPAGDYSLGAHASALRDLVGGVLGIEWATLVGQSLGGGVAMQLAYQFPELCERLVLVASGGLGREVSRVLRLFTLPAAEYLMPALFPRFVRESGAALIAFLRRLGIFEGAGHFLHAEQPTRFAELLGEFIETTEPARRDLASYRELLRARPAERHASDMAEPRDRADRARMGRDRRDPARRARAAES